MSMFEENSRVRMVDNDIYLGMLKELIQQGKEVPLLVSGNSMSPLIIHQRDTVLLTAVKDPVKRGTIVFYNRPDGAYVLHRVVRVNPDGSFNIIGDGQLEIEYNVKREQIFAEVIAIQRKGKWIHPGDFWWWFFKEVWSRCIPMRFFIRKVYGNINNNK